MNQLIAKSCSEIRRVNKLLTATPTQTKCFCNKRTSLFCRAAMEKHVFCIFIHYRGHHRKGVAIYVRISQRCSVPFTRPIKQVSGKQTG